VGTTLNNLALVYRDQGKYDEAEALFKRALTIREQATQMNLLQLVRIAPVAFIAIRTM
jgi:tetratricopeptide (TPR) repeat protein